VRATDLLTVGEVAERAGVSVPTVRYYEERGLITSTRTTGNQRRFERSALRRIAVIAAAQRIGLSLDQVRDAMADLPVDRAPNRREWTAMSRAWRRMVQRRIDELTALQSDLDGCIGCGCLSLQRCSIFNPSDEAASEGAGARWVRKARA
jgi:MerR family transcriptional regulator, redox-sensitive transcriptional activator SoxR